MWLLVFPLASWKSKRLSTTSERTDGQFLSSSENTTVGKLPSISRVADAGAVVEENAHRTVRQLEPKAVLVGIVDPFGNEQRVALHCSGIARGCVEQSINQYDPTDNQKG